MKVAVVLDSAVGAVVVVDAAVVDVVGAVEVELLGQPCGCVCILTY